VANAVFTPRKYDSELLKVPIQVLNPSSQLVTLHQGTKVAEVDSSIVCGVSQQGPCMPSVVPEDILLTMQELFWGVVEKSEPQQLSAAKTVYPASCCLLQMCLLSVMMT